MKKQFDFQKLEVYKKALDFVVLAAESIEALPRGNAYFADELLRSSTSIALNIAEGAGEFSPREKARFYRMAKRSATESAGLIDVLKRRCLVPEQLLDRGLDILFEVVSMLTRMVRNRLEKEGKGRGKHKGKGSKR